MRENDGSAFALVDIGHSPALDFQELLSSERLCAIGHCSSPCLLSEPSENRCPFTFSATISSSRWENSVVNDPKDSDPFVFLFLFPPLRVKLRDRLADRKSPGKHYEILEFL